MKKRKEEKNIPASVTGRDEMSISAKESLGKPRVRRSIPKKVLDIIGIAVFSFVLPILVINLILIVESYASPSSVPSLLGVTPMVVVTGSMSPEIEAGDMILDRKAEVQDIQAGDVISFYDPLDQEHTEVITHRITEIVIDSHGRTCYRTKGDANNTVDPVLIPYENVIGTYRLKIPYLGNVVLYLRTVPGMIIFVFIPILLMVGYDFFCQKAYVGRKEKETVELRAEIERLHAVAKEKPQATL